MLPNERQARIHRDRAHRLANDCRMAEAIDELRLAVGHDTRDGRSWQLLGQLYGAAGYHEQAVSYIQLALAEDFNNMAAWIVLINLYAQIGGPYFELALEQVDLAKEVNDRIPDLHYLEGNILAQRGELDAARRALQQALELNPSHQHAANDLAAIS